MVSGTQSSGNIIDRTPLNRLAQVLSIFAELNLVQGATATASSQRRISTMARQPCLLALRNPVFLLMIPVTAA
jgi:hypothetical protein